MQGMTRVRRWFDRNRPRRDEAATRRRDLRLGVLGVLLVALAMAAVAVLYVVPFGKRTYTAELTEAQSVRPGDDVRLAGISVGSVESLELQQDRVLMTFTVDSSVFVGKESSLDIRMLTIVGGHYVALFPAGNVPLGSRTIPSDRVRLPYSLIQAFQDAVEPIRRVDGGGLRDNLAAMADSLEASPDSLRRTLDGVEHFVDVLDQQRADVSKAIGIADEYLTAVGAAKGELGRLVEKINLLETLLADKRTEVRTAVEALDRVISRLGALQSAWGGTLRPMAEQLAAAVPELERLGERLQPVIDDVHALGERLGQLVPREGEVVIDHSNTTVQAPPAEPICVPVAGRVC
ncbi:MCE family protein [Nocardia amikacinitolerans]|uniref:MCE family protein n=1 Tax=Nocardia amikacinitolerans TaxID=756689 RepID=UPI0020A5F15A|nr:MCE family protein [Nocardia amikacinitolerans]MCP2292725.1 phospholipid/cholesterol/gamma-HCH transport system substrate-binding protein [Nocardia amikacinitolerans]